MHMTIPRVLVSLLAGLFVVAAPWGRQAKAGDPCPISFMVHELGSPPWLDTQAVLEGLVSKSIWIGINYRDKEPPIRITRVYAGSPAAAAGLLPDDILLRVGELPVKDKATADHAFEVLRPGQTAVFRIRRGETVLDKSLTFRLVDPLVRILVRANQRRDCLELYQEKTPLVLSDLQSALFTDKHGFRCRDAHLRLQQDVPEGGATGHIVVVRGNQRVLLALVGWKTLCVRATDYDGKKLTDDRVQALLDRLTGDLVDHRFKHP
jgi:hypothetical protein